MCGWPGERHSCSHLGALKKHLQLLELLQKVLHVGRSNTLSHMFQMSPIDRLVASEVTDPALLVTTTV